MEAYHAKSGKEPRRVALGFIGFGIAGCEGSGG